MAAVGIKTKNGGTFVRTTGKGFMGDRRLKRQNTRGAQKKAAMRDW